MATGLSDFGSDGWQLGLDHLLDALSTDLARQPDLQSAIADMLVARLANRLRVEEWYRLSEERPPPMQGPLVIVGLPRSATTALHYLLGIDPQFRFTRGWEMAEPVPPPDPATEAGDRRRRAALSSNTDVQHISSADGPVEDGMIHALHFGHQEMAIPVPTYTRWWRHRDLTGTFGYQERVLRLLHSRRPPHLWLLKAPAYLFHLGSMSRHYPAARFVMTHRDPTRTIPSACSVVYTTRRSSLPAYRQDKASLGADMLEHFAEGMRMAMAARGQIGEDRFLDVSHEQVEEHPVRTAQRIYGFAGLDLSEETLSRMQDWAAANRRGSRGAHDYSAEDYGLFPAKIDEEFADYRRAFASYL